MINILINGKKESIQEDLTILKLLESKKIKPQVVTVELNDKILAREDFSKITLKEADRLEFVYFMGGGSTQTPSASSLTIEESTKRMSRTILSEGAKRPSRRKDWYVYILRCQDDSLYTGLTDNVERRFSEHLSGKGSLYTRDNKPIEVAYKEKFYNFLDAQEREIQIKGWSRKKKEALINGDLELLKRL